jgi:streptogramin lyase
MTRRHHAARWTHRSSSTRKSKESLRRRAPWLEPLEDRQLLSGIQEYSALLTNNTNGAPTELTLSPNFGSDGNIWFTEPTANEIGVFNTNTNRVANQVFTTATNANPPAIASTTGSNASVWFTIRAAGQLGMSNPSAPSQTPVIWNFFSHGVPLPSTAGIAVDGANLWLTAPGGNELIEIAAGSTTPSFTTSVPVSPSILGFQNFSSNIIVGNGGTLWFTEASVNSSGIVTASGIGSYTPSSGAWSQVLLPTSGGAGQEPFGLTLGPGGNIWFTAAVQSGSGGFATSYVGEINANPANPTLVAEIPTGSGTQPNGITVGPDGNIWFTETGAGKIGVVNVSNNDQLLSFTIPTNVVSDPKPAGIISTGSGGALWFADESGAMGTVNTQQVTQLVVSVPAVVSVNPGSTFTVTVADQRASGAVDTTFNGPVTIAFAPSGNPGSSALGGTTTVNAVNGVATFSGLTLNNAANGYALQATAGGTNPPSPSSPSNAFDAVVGQVTKLIVTTQLPGTISTGVAFSVVVQDEFVSNNQVDTSFNGPVTIALSSPPGASGIGGATTVNAVNGVATFTGLTLNNPGNGYMLQVTSPGVNPQTIGPINVITAQTPTITGETITFQRKLNKKGKPVGKPIAVVITFDFGTPMDAASLTNAANYQVGAWVTKKVRKKKVSVLRPVGFRLNSPASNSLRLTIPGKQPFAKGGQITIMGSPPTGIESAQGVFLGSNPVFTVLSNARGIT